jgi:hypothetical protein
MGYLVKSLEKIRLEAAPVWDSGLMYLNQVAEAIAHEKVDDEHGGGG